MTEEHTPDAAPAPDLTDTACRVVMAYVSRNHVAKGDLPALLRSTYGALVRLENSVPKQPGKPDAAAIAASIRRDTLISFEDDRPYKALRRHLTMRGLTPEDYRRKWGLPVDYPMVAASYSERRSGISRQIVRHRPGSPDEALAEAEPVKQSIDHAA